MATSKKQPTFPGSVIDKQERRDRRKAIERYIEGFPEKIAELSDERILDAKDIESVNNIASMSSEDYTAHIKGLFKSYLSRVGFCPQEERKRIADNFNSMLERTAGTVEWLHNFKEAGYKFKTDKDGLVIPDAEGAFKKADEDTEDPVNVAKLTEYYNLWKGLAEAWQHLNDFERSNGMGATTSDTKIGYMREYAGSIFYGEAMAKTIIRDIADTDLFFEIFGSRFKA